jgi:hypothetical protein
MFCVWYAIREDNAGHTWHPLQKLREVLQKKVSGVATNLVRAIKLGVRSGWLAIHRDASQQLWIADGEKAADEDRLAAKIRQLLDGPHELPRFTEALPGECDETDRHVEFVGGDEQVPDGQLDTDHLARLGQETGICQFCGRLLTSDESKRRGYGPVCASRHGLSWGDENVTDLQSNSDTEVAHAPLA